MALLTHSNGTSAVVPDDLVDRFVSLGWKRKANEKPAPQKRADSHKKSE